MNYDNKLCYLFELVVRKAMQCVNININIDINSVIVQ